MPAGRAMSVAWDQDEAYRFVEELFAKHQHEIYAYLVRMLRDPELAADLTQDAFVKAYKAYDSLQKPENARAWLYQIAHRVALDDLRRKRSCGSSRWSARPATRRRPRSTSSWMPGSPVSSSGPSRRSPSASAPRCCSRSSTT